jgi:hypothetical protein
MADHLALATSGRRTGVIDAGNVSTSLRRQSATARKPNPVTPTFFADPKAFRQWLRENHRTAEDLVVGFYKRDSGKPSITRPESVDQALCFGWIDGIRRRIDDESYSIRFTPRRPQSVWSTVNIKRCGGTRKAGPDAGRRESGLCEAQRRKVTHLFVRAAVSREAGAASAAVARGQRESLDVLSSATPLVPATGHVLDRERQVRGNEATAAAKAD